MRFWVNMNFGGTLFNPVQVVRELKGWMCGAVERAEWVNGEL